MVFRRAIGNSADARMSRPRTTSLPLGHIGDCSAPSRYPSLPAQEQVVPSGRFDSDQSSQESEMSDPHGDPSSLDPTRDRYVRQRNAARSWSLAIVAVAVVLAVAYYLHGPFAGSSAPANDPAVTAAPAPAAGVPPAGSGRNHRTARAQGAVEKSLLRGPVSARLSVCADEMISDHRAQSGSRDCAAALSCRCFQISASCRSAALSVSRVNFALLPGDNDVSAPVLIQITSI
jgi:hypothetical protein